MNELTGTVTLAYVEEDNRQRAIFRLIPLCTREGFLFHGTKEEFPDEGSLRIVPDKREQGTFKERMRGLCGFCTLSLPPEGKDRMKIRSNRNYNPEGGENNRNAIYSDVVCQFLPDGCFEVVEAGADASHALTEKVLVQKDMLLYGPLLRKELPGADLSALKPFGNDSFLLHIIETASTGKRKVYWNPDMLINWRQHKTAAIKKEKSEAASREKAAHAENEQPASAVRNHQENKPNEGVQPPQEPKPETGSKPVTEPKPAGNGKQASKKKAQEMPKKGKGAKAPLDAPTEKAAEPVKPEKPNKAGKPEKAAKQSRQPKEAHPKAAQKPAEDGENALPIGQTLTILDEDISFDQQLSRLAQPLSDGANRLSSEVQNAPASEEEAVEEEEEEKGFRPAGTELKKDSMEIDLPDTEPVNVFRVVEKTLRLYGNGGSGNKCVTNPISCLRDCIDAIWQDSGLREQAVRVLMENGEFMGDLTSALRSRGCDLQIMAAAEEQLAEIEAERLELLMQLSTARENEKQYQKEALEKVHHKRKDEAERLKKELERLRAEKNRLLAAEKTLSTGNQALIRQFLLTNADVSNGMTGEGAVLSPVIGEPYEEGILAENLRINMNNNGFSISEDEAQVLLICFGLFDTLCLAADTQADAVRFASILLDSLGLQSVSAVLHKESGLKIVNLLSDQENRTPTVSIQPVGSDIVRANGHKVLLASDSTGVQNDAFTEMLAYPVLPVSVPERDVYMPQFQEGTVVSPAALSSFNHLEDASKKLLGEAEKWFDELQACLEDKGIHLSQTLFAAMRRFVSTASNVLRGGFPLAADFAVSLWIVPVLRRHGQGVEALEGISAGLNRSVSALQGGMDA